VLLVSDFQFRICRDKPRLPDQLRPANAESNPRKLIAPKACQLMQGPGFACAMMEHTLELTDVVEQ